MNIQGKFGITVLGSGSKGNASVIHGPEGLILLDAGFTAKELENRMCACGIHASDIKAIIVTHEHSDHMKQVANNEPQVLIRKLAVSGHKEWLQYQVTYITEAIRSVTTLYGLITGKK